MIRILNQVSWTAILQPNFELFKKTEKMSYKIELHLIFILLQSPPLSKCNWFCSDHLKVDEIDMGVHSGTEHEG